MGARLELDDQAVVCRLELEFILAMISWASSRKKGIPPK